MSYIRFKCVSTAQHYVGKKRDESSFYVQNSLAKHHLGFLIQDFIFQLQKK